MTITNIMRIVPGAMIIISVLLAIYHSEWWLALTLFVGANLFQSGFTGFCPLEIILKKLNVPER